jgi:hypothetical protein
MRGGTPLTSARAVAPTHLCLLIGMLGSCAAQPPVSTNSGFAPPDPGWGYRAVNGTLVQEDGGRYDIIDPSHGALRAYASDFTTDLSVEVDVSGFTSPTPQNAILSMDVIDGWGRSLPRREHPRAVNRCRLGGRPRSGFPAGTNVCTIANDFRILDFGASTNTITIVLNWVDGSAYTSRIDMVMVTAR